jgi:hypothetical protein
LSIRGSTNYYFFYFNVRDKGDDHIFEGSTILTILIASRGPFPRTNYTILLVASKRKPGKFERVGILEAKDRPFAGAEVMTLDIV